MNALNFLKSYPFKDLDQILFPNDSLVQALIEEQSDEEGNEERGDSPSIKDWPSRSILT